MVTIFKSMRFLCLHTTDETVSLENAPLLAAFSNRPGFGNGLDRCRVNRRRNRIGNDAVTNETRFRVIIAFDPKFSSSLASFLVVDSERSKWKNPGRTSQIFLPALTF